MNLTRMLAVLLILVCSAILPIIAEAATFTVNSTIDEGDIVQGDGACAAPGNNCTLRAAIQEANALPGADTIVLKAKKYYLTIPGINEDFATSGDLDIVDHLTIKGVSSAKTIINGGALDRVFHITVPVTVKFVNLSIQNGFVQDNGAGIFNVGGTVSLNSCSVANNVSSDSGILLGGGICSVGIGSSLRIKSSSVIKNMVISSTDAAYGGGVAVTDGGTLNISASKIAYNSAMSSAYLSFGGGISSRFGAGVTITNCTVLANSVVASNASYGGGIALEQNDTATVITGTNISMNTSTSFGANAWGGGLYFHTEDGTISSCTIKENRANANAPAGPESNGYAGGIVARLSSHITINNESMIIQNLASYHGGGILNHASTITVSPDSTVANNMPNDEADL